MAGVARHKGAGGARMRRESVIEELKPWAIVGREICIYGDPFNWIGSNRLRPQGPPQVSMSLNESSRRRQNLREQPPERVIPFKHSKGATTVGGTTANGSSNQARRKDRRNRLPRQVSMPRGNRSEPRLNQARHTGNVR